MPLHRGSSETAHHDPVVWSEHPTHDEPHKPAPAEMAQQCVLPVVIHVAEVLVLHVWAFWLYFSRPAYWESLRLASYQRGAVGWKLLSDLDFC